MVKTVVVIPCRPSDVVLAERVVPVYQKRAGAPCEVYVVEDKDGIGWVKLQNEMAAKLEFDWYCYTADDYFPGRNWLKLALEAAQQYNKRFVCFNDGKWFGENATAGLAHKSLIPELYSTGTLLNPNYIWHGSDPDLTHRAKALNEFIYVPNAVMMEIDYEKLITNNAKKGYRSDRKLRERRQKEGWQYEV